MSVSGFAAVSGENHPKPLGTVDVDEQCGFVDLIHSNTITVPPSVPTSVLPTTIQPTTVRPTTIRPTSVPPTVIRCVKSPPSWTDKSSSEHLIIIEVNGESHSFAVDKSEIPNVSYAIVMALTDVLGDLFNDDGDVNDVNDNRPHKNDIDLFVDDLFVFNIFTKNSLPKWKNNNWMSTTGKPIAYVDILSLLCETMENKNLKFKTHWIRVTN